MGVSTFWRGRRVLVTGHTGFKGAWLCLWLERLGAQVSALALAPDTEPALYDVLKPWTGQSHHEADIRDLAALSAGVAAAEPEIVIHMAAQALVRRSYADPVETFATNVLGTVNLLSAVRGVPGIEAVVVVTTDKVYANDNAGRPFGEDDALGGKDPYSSSKACAELATQCFRDSFFSTVGPKIATARAGNVIGGGDWSADRLVPDFVRALSAGAPVRLRYPDSVRPWQHVLEPLSGYLTLAEVLVSRPDAAPTAINFGPDPDSFASVAQVAEGLGRAFGMTTPWLPAGGTHPPEAKALLLRSDRAAEALGWRPRLSMADTISWTADWYRAYRAGADMRAVCLEQIARYEELAS
ncbi:CDP-glucose 4,6-dehydratase [Azorhizobium doebereinerae]|uniref:CDP-glucose 4,6-dehydratase n=1 Tax=Azorhizobium doebereinerae TaxID=281091 RepID=UPI00048B4EC6|nr:CDP-glucose 4,6-dehydratase [Azorhizobium doebereinerae]